MMTSMGGNRARGSREQTQSQTQHKQRPQATAEQIRLAQMISDHNDADFEEKVKQVSKGPQSSYLTPSKIFHSCSNTPYHNFPDPQSNRLSLEAVLGRLKLSLRCNSTRKGGPLLNSFARGNLCNNNFSKGSHQRRYIRGQENGLDGGKTGVAGRGAERGRRGRGRGRGAVGISGRRGGRFSAQGMGTFNPADYAEPAQTEDGYAGGSTWNNTGSAEMEEATSEKIIQDYPQTISYLLAGVWRTATEEWGTEDWNEDLSETKIFTASTVAPRPVPQENVTITKGQRIDLAVLLGKTPPTSSSETENPVLEGTQPSSLSQSMVFSNSKQGVPLSQTSSSTPYTQHSMVSMLNKGFGDVGDAKGASTGTTGSQFLEQYKTAQALAQLAAQHSQTGPPNTTPSSWETSGSSLGQYDAFLQDKGLPPSSAVSSPSLLPQQTTSAPHVVPPPASALPKMATVPSLGQQVSPSSSDAQSPLPLQQHKLKQQKKRTSITTKIPAMAVEMPGSTDISGLNLQFGALQFGSEPVLPEYETSPSTTTPANQVQSSLYTSPRSETPPDAPLPTLGLLLSSEGYAAKVTQPSVSSMGTLTDSPTSLLNSTNQPSLSALGHSDDLPPSTIPPPQHNKGSVSPDPLRSTTRSFMLDSVARKRKSPDSCAPFVKIDGDFGKCCCLLPLLNNGSHPSQQNSLAPSSVRTSNSSLLHPSVDGDSSLHSSSFPSSVPVAPSSVPSSSSVAAAQVSLGAPQASSMGSATVSAASGLGPVSSLAMGLNNASTSSSSTRGSAASSAGKAPPNLPPGVPPLLPNPYIMAPGLLHAYPPQVYGYDDLQMLQTRIPLDYYSIPFATPTTALTGREGSLTNNPYSGDLSKFGRGDASSPAPATTLAQTQQNQTQTHHTTQQPFLNPALPPGYSYTSLPYYTGMPGLPNTFQYGPAVFPVAPTSSKQHGVNVGVNASATPFQQASGYGSHGYSTGYEDVGQASGSGDFCKGGYGTAVAAAAASAQSKPASSVTGPGVGVSVTSSNTGVPDISGSVYTKTQSFEKQGFHAGTPAASFSLPSALGSGGPINPPAAAGYAPAPFMHILAPHQQPHSQILHHHLQQDGQSGTGQRSQNTSIQQKSQMNKSAYNSYNWGAN
uniref:Ubiquitin associated protein 2-like n=1 Tax=Tetraodon nigroviridis TaxID=99883 RepID=H3DJL7_TETNG